MVSRETEDDELQPDGTPKCRLTTKLKELPRSIELQVEAFLDGRKPAVLFMNYDAKHYLPAFECYDIGQGELVVRSLEYLNYAKEGKLGLALGYGIDRKIGNRCLTVFSKDGEVIVDITTDGRKSVEDAARKIAGNGFIEYRDTDKSTCERRKYWHDFRKLQEAAARAAQKS